MTGIKFSTIRDVCLHNSLPRSAFIFTRYKFILKYIKNLNISIVNINNEGATALSEVNMYALCYV
jgi:hypothetical protein